MAHEKEAAPESVDAYIAAFPPDIRRILESYRAAIREAAPDAVEGISYGMPAYRLNGPLVYFAAHKAHVGMYPLPRPNEALAAEIARFATTKGGIQFPYGREAPLGLVKAIVRARMEENLAKPPNAYGSRDA